MPGGHGVRLDTHVYSGYTIPPIMIDDAKLITTQTREEAISKMRRALICYWRNKTTIPFHRQLMDDPRYIWRLYAAFMDTFKMIAPE
jgi:acetyl-CoA carboxylase biotin carboxylase subunit